PQPQFHYPSSERVTICAPSHSLPRARGRVRVGAAPAPILTDFAPGQLVLVVEQVAELRARDGGEAPGGLVIGRTLELDGADKMPAGSGGEPALDQRLQPRRIADDVRKQPIHG